MHSYGCNSLDTWDPYLINRSPKSLFLNWESNGANDSQSKVGEDMMKHFKAVLERWQGCGRADNLKRLTKSHSAQLFIWKLNCFSVAYDTQISRYDK